MKKKCLSTLFFLPLYNFEHNKMHNKIDSYIAKQNKIKSSYIDYYFFAILFLNDFLIFYFKPSKLTSVKNG